MLFFLQNVVAVSATLLTAPLAARSHVCVLLATRTLCRQFRMDSPLDSESPPQRMAFSRAPAVFLRGYAIAATGVPLRGSTQPSHTRRSLTPYLGSKPPPLLLFLGRAAEVGLVRQARGQGLAPLQ